VKQKTQRCSQKRFLPYQAARVALPLALQPAVTRDYTVPNSVVCTALGAGAMGSVLDQTYKFISEMQAASTPQEICTTLTGFCSNYGLTAVLAGTCPTAKSRGEDQVTHIFAQSYPTPWMQRYLEESYSDIDPVIHRLHSNLSPFHWSEAIQYVNDDNAKRARQMMGEAAEFKLKNGVVIPMLTLEGEVAAVSIGGETPELPRECLGTLSLISSYAMARAIELRSRRALRSTVKLTSREVECLRWAADGKSEWEISSILCISEHTADKHLSNARSKLMAVTRTQAVARALRLGLIH
jgi:LuxR family transcriptional regulator, quorum-sensing system regulator BjaR1